MGSIRLYGATSGYLELQAPDVAPDATLTLPSDSVQPGLVHLHTETFSAVSSVSVDSCFSSTYDVYRIIFDLSSVSADMQLRMRLRLSGTDNASSLYYTAGSTSTTGGVTSGFYENGVGYGLVSGADSGNPTWNALSLDVYNPNAGRATRFVGAGTYTTPAASWQSTAFAVLHNVATAYDGITFYASAGDMTGSLRVYGYRNS